MAIEACCAKNVSRLEISVLPVRIQVFGRNCLIGLFHIILISAMTKEFMSIDL